MSPVNLNPRTSGNIHGIIDSKLSDENYDVMGNILGRGGGGSIYKW